MHVCGSLHVAHARRLRPRGPWAALRRLDRAGPPGPARAAIASRRGDEGFETRSRGRPSRPRRLLALASPALVAAGPSRSGRQDPRRQERLRVHGAELEISSSSLAWRGKLEKKNQSPAHGVYADTLSTFQSTLPEDTPRTFQSTLPESCAWGTPGPPRLSRAVPERRRRDSEGEPRAFDLMWGGWGGGFSLAD
jgi:hypothetical protein